MLLTSSDKNASNNTTIGVGLLLSLKSYQALDTMELINPQTLIATFNGNPSTNVISCYSPTNVSDEDDVTDFMI